MARSGFIGTIGTALTDGETIPFTHAGNDGGVALAAAVATAVADGATPTQAHVTAINTALPTVQGDIQLSWDTGKVTKVNQLKRAFDQFLRAARASGMSEA